MSACIVPLIPMLIAGGMIKSIISAIIYLGGYLVQIQQLLLLLLLLMHLYISYQLHLVTRVQKDLI